jgi:thiamine biosynthesis lipoprotein
MSLSRVHEAWAFRFVAMASPCELLVDTDDRAEAEALGKVAQAEAARIEATFSRYLEGNVVDRINRAAGAPVAVDDETALLLDYAAACHQMSGGRFDITSGALRRAWKFDGSSRVPSAESIQAALQHVGWHRARWADHVLTLPAGMEIDFGGIGKEYAVDRAAGLLAARTGRAFLVNFGGDLFAAGARREERPWAVGVDDPTRPGEAQVYRIEIKRGGLATSGDARRFVMHEGRRLGHILDPKTGWPVESAPRSVTVLAPTCMEAGTLSTLAYLQGSGAQAFLEAEGVTFWIL